MTDKQSWKRAQSRRDDKSFRVPQVADDLDDSVPEDAFIEDYYEWASSFEDEDQRKSGGKMKLVSTLIGAVGIVSFYAIAFYFGIRALGVESFDYKDAVIVSASFVFVRYTDATLIDQSRRR